MGAKKQMLRRLIAVLTLTVLMVLSGCRQSGEQTDSGGLTLLSEETDSAQQRVEIDTQIETDTTASATKTVAGSQAVITLQGETAEISGSGAKYTNGDIVLTAAGTYTVSGTLSDGRIVINAPKKDVIVILNGASVTCSDSSAFYVYQADNVTLTAYEGSVNLLTDGSGYSYQDAYSSAAEEEPNAAVYSKADLTVNGTGKLVVRGNCKNGLTGKDDLLIEDLTLSVSAVNHGITGRDSAVFQNANILVAAAGDAIRSNNDEDAGKGTVTLAGGTFRLTAGEDGIQAETALTVESGTLAITSGGGAAKTPDSQISTKGLKGAASVTVKGGAVSVDSSDDAIHSNGDITITGGSLSLASGDDGLHADDTLTISGGSITVSQSYEGLEATNITVSGGDITLTAEDDGVNICGGDGSADLGRPGMDRFSSSSGGIFKITGGFLSVNAAGDGLDANGSIEMTGGTLLVDGPTNNGNGALDYDNSCTISGGLFVAVGSSGMAQSPSNSSNQNSLVFTLSGGASAGTLLCLQEENGTVICTYAPAKAYSWVCISAPALKNGATYTLYTGGRASGSEKSGLYTGGSYQTGEEVASLTVSGAVTSFGGSGGNSGFGGAGGFGGGMGGHGFRP